MKKDRWTDRRTYRGHSKTPSDLEWGHEDTRLVKELNYAEREEMTRENAGQTTLIKQTP